MEIRPPYGYQEIVPLTRQHRVRAQEAGKVPPPFRSVNAVPLSYAEFVAACRDYPIAFISADGGTSYVAMAVLGILFLRSAARTLRTGPVAEDPSSSPVKDAV